MIRRLLLPALAAGLLGGCATGYSYRGGVGDYYYGQPSVEYRYYGVPYGGYGPYGYYGYPGYNYLPYGYYGYWNNYGYPYYYVPIDRPDQPPDSDPPGDGSGDPDAPPPPPTTDTLSPARPPWGDVDGRTGRRDDPLGERPPMPGVRQFTPMPPVTPAPRASTGLPARPTPRVSTALPARPPPRASTRSSQSGSASDRKRHDIHEP